MKAIIPVAGLGSRMRPHTHTQPKVLLQVAGKAMLDHIIDDLVAAGVDGVTLVTGYLGDRIEEHVRKQYSHLTLNFVRQDQMLGLGHAIALCKKIHENDDRLLIILGDTIVKADFAKMFSLGESALAVKAVDDPRRFGTVENRKGTNEIIGLIEKAENPPTNLAIVGVYLVNDPKLLFAGLDHIMNNNIRTKNEYQLTDALAYMLAKNHRMLSFEITEWLDCGKPETLLETNRRLLDLNKADNSEELRRQFPKAVIIPPVHIGRNCRLENSVVGPYVSTMDNVTIIDSIVKDSTIGQKSALKRVNLHNSMIGEETQVEAVSGALNVGDHSTVNVAE
ncbi:NTP transferase domain-containing protein [Candidatus Sumerlaeota bacterium]|nr:NTP transferase domain-containing protein [Candidatus Sumerlaeota bacterium]